MNSEGYIIILVVITVIAGWLGGNKKSSGCYAYIMKM